MESSLQMWKRHRVVVSPTMPFCHSTSQTVCVGRAPKKNHGANLPICSGSKSSNVKDSKSSNVKDSSSTACASHLTSLNLLSLVDFIKLICRFVVKLKGSSSNVPSQATGRGISGRKVREGDCHLEVATESRSINYCFLYFCFSS